MKHSVVTRFSICLVLGLLLVGSLFMGGAAEAGTSTPRMADLTVTDQVSSGQDVAITVTLRDKAPTGGVSIKLASSHSALSIDSSLAIGAGKTNATTIATTKAVGKRTKAVVSATYGGVTKTETVVISPIALASISAPATVNHGESADVTVTLTAPAPTGGSTVRLVGNRPSVLTVPVNVTVPAGSTSAVANVTAFTHRGDADVTVTAKLSRSADKATIVKVLGSGFPDATATATASNTPEPTTTNTPEPTMTNTPEPTATETSTAVPTETATATNTAVPIVIQIVVPAGHSATITGMLGGADHLSARYLASTGETGFLGDNYFGIQMPVQTSVFESDTVLVIELTDYTCGRVYNSDGARGLVTLIDGGYQVDVADSGGGTCSGADGERIITTPGTGNFTGQVTIDPESTPTATNTPEPTATNTAEPTATNTAEPQSLTVSEPVGDGHVFTVEVCLVNSVETPVTVDLTTSVSPSEGWVDLMSGSQLFLSSETPCGTVWLHSDTFGETPWVVTLTATLNGVPFSSLPMSFGYPYPV